MVSLRGRLRRLERSPLFQHRPDPVDPIIGLALRQISDEVLALLISVAIDQDAGVYRTLSQSESAAVAAYEAALANANDGARSDSRA
jgi:hypothetical protein